MIPKLKKNKNYTNSKKIEIHTGYSEHSPRVNPHNVNWHKYGRRLPPYKFMQSPGKHNALGKIKYLFPNKYSVYMHDTNQPYLFSKDVRSLSHGCVRLHKPVELLETFSIMDSKINFEKAQATLEHNKKTPLRLSHSIPIDMIYLTTWVEPDGTVAFRDDIYGYVRADIRYFDTDIDDPYATISDTASTITKLKVGVITPPVTTIQGLPLKLEFYASDVLVSGDMEDALDTDNFYVLGTTFHLGTTTMNEWVSEVSFDINIVRGDNLDGFNFGFGLSF